MTKWIGRIWIGFLLVLTAVSIPQCLFNADGGGWFNRSGLQSALDPLGPVAGNQADLFYLTLWVTLFLFVTVGGALALATIRYRRRKDEPEGWLPEQSHGHPVVEVGLILGSSVLLVIIAVPTFAGIVLKKEVPAEYAEDAITVNVTGYQWWWGFEYPETGIHTANELVFPAGRAVKLNLHADDVIHSFWLPKLAGKTDLIPGENNTMWIKADEPGIFWGQCAEYCGESHAYMLFRAKALPEAEWEAWLARQAEPTVKGDGSYEPLVAESLPAGGEVAEQLAHGAELFKANCARCHSVDPRVQTMGPNLAHFGGRLTIAAGWLDNEPENLARWIREPHEIKPGNFMWRGFPDPNNPRMVQMEGLDGVALNGEEIDALVTYLYALQ